MMMNSDKKALILWADDEIDLLRPHVIFLENQGYKLITVNNGLEAIERVAELPIDVVILDEHMPGISGLRTLSLIKEKFPHLPVIMITKSEEEDIMNKAIGGKIADYLIKPVNPRQILSSLKKLTEGNRLVSETSANRYVDEFRDIADSISRCDSLQQWKELYARLTYWQVELSDSSTVSQAVNQMREMLEDQLIEAEKVFFKFILRNYHTFFNDGDILLSNDILPQVVLPLIKKGEKPWLVLIDNFRLDQWYELRQSMTEFFRIERDDIYCSILPTATQYARNAVFSGLLPAEIKKSYPDMWVDERSEAGKNECERHLLQKYFERIGMKVELSYNKITESMGCEDLLSGLSNISDKDLKVIVINFIDLLSHERTHSRAVRELSSTEAGFRSLTKSWFLHSPVGLLFQKMASMGEKIILTTDHGTVRVSRPVKVLADKSSSDTVRYKIGKNIRIETKDYMHMSDPKQFGLPVSGIAESYDFAAPFDYFVYQNNYSNFVKLYDGTYQHGGISLQEMLVPLVTLTPK